MDFLSENGGLVGKYNQALFIGTQANGEHLNLHMAPLFVQANFFRIKR